MFGLFTIYRSVACGQLQFFVNAQGVDHVLPGQDPVRGQPGNGLPSLSPMCAQARSRFTQVIHTVMHSNPDKNRGLTVLCGCSGLTETGLLWLWTQHGILAAHGGYLRLRFSPVDLEQLPPRTRLDPGTARWPSRRLCYNTRSTVTARD